MWKCRYFHFLQSQCRLWKCTLVGLHWKRLQPHLCTYDMPPDVAWPGVAITVAVEARYWTGAAALQLAPKHVACRGPPGAVAVGPAAHCRHAEGRLPPGERRQSRERVATAGCRKNRKHPCYSQSNCHGCPVALARGIRNDRPVPRRWLCEGLTTLVLSYVAAQF